jgi:putative transposase
MSQRRHLRQLVASKRSESLPLSPEAIARGFKGWHERGRLPHFDAPGVIQFITYRLADSMPVALRHVWEPIERIADARERITRREAFLDEGHGACHLRAARAAAFVEENLLRHDGAAYCLLGWCVMPNHVHVLLRVEQLPLDRILHAWKSYTATRINRLLARRGKLWQEEYYDRFIRDRDQLDKAVRYLESNPVKARLSSSPADWPWGSARLRAGSSAARFANPTGVVLTGDELERRLVAAEPASALLRLRQAAEAQAASSAT